jgi:hypothetical protein
MSIPCPPASHIFPPSAMNKRNIDPQHALEICTPLPSNPI